MAEGWEKGQTSNGVWWRGQEEKGVQGEGGTAVVCFTAQGQAAWPSLTMAQ